MIELIGEEGKADKDKLDWGNSERKENKDSRGKKNKEILSLEGDIDQLTKDIEDPKTGLKAEIAELEQSLVDNTEAQKKQTGERTEANLAYQADIRNLVAAQGILAKALKVLKAYYDDLEERMASNEAFVQEDPNPPEAWAGDSGVTAGKGDVG